MLLFQEQKKVKSMFVSYKIESIFAMREIKLEEGSFQLKILKT
jgi:hypothetical protein